MWGGFVFEGCFVFEGLVGESRVKVGFWEVGFGLGREVVERGEEVRVLMRDWGRRDV